MGKGTLTLPGLFCAIIVGCGGPTDNESIRLDLTPGSAQVFVGDTVRLVASGVDSVTWTSSNPLVAFVDDLGLVSGIAVGAATITARATRKPAVTDEAAISVMALPPLKQVLIIAPARKVVAVGEQVAFRWVVAGFANPTVQWSSSDPSIATVNADGVSVARARGRALITLALVADPSWRATAILDIE